MREILFRGKRIDNGEWIDGNLICNDDACFIAEKTKYSFIGYCAICNRPFDSTYEIRPETVFQYTGLTDKNGKKIFEGDIVKLCNGLYDSLIAVVKFGEYVSPCDPDLFGGHVGFYLDFKKRADMLRKDFLYWKKNEYIEIIGNIFDNPELLEGI